MNQELHVTWIQANLVWENTLQNIANFEQKLQEIEQADVVFLPEMFSTGFSMQPHKYAEEMDGSTVNWMRNMSAKFNFVLAGSLIIKNDKNEYVNRLIWTQPDGKIEFYDKRHLFSYAGEHKHYSSGNKRKLFTYKGWNILPQICFDLRFPVWSRNDLDYDFAFYVANWPEKRSFAWKQLLVARAIENQAYVLGVNRVGLDGNGIPHSGNSVMLDALGEEMSASAPHKEAISSATLNKEKLNAVRERFRFLNEQDTFNVLL